MSQSQVRHRERRSKATMNQDQYSGILRHILTIAAGIVVSKGYTDESTATTIVAGIVAALTVFWSIKSKGTK
jgi:hypothetical protein